MCESQYEVSYTKKNGEKGVRSFPTLEDALSFVNYCFTRFMAVSTIKANGKILLPYLDTKGKRDFFFTLMRNKEIESENKTYRMHKDGLEVEFHKKKIIRFPTLHDFFAFKFTSFYRSTTYFYNRVVSEEVKRETYYDKDGNPAYEMVDTKREEKKLKNPNIQTREKESSQY